MKLEIKQLHKSFNGIEVLKGISFVVEGGKALGLLGRNGAGKTTIMRIIMNVFNANSGEILLDGSKFERNKVQIGYLPEERGLYPKKTVLEQLVYLGKLRGISGKEAKKNTEMWLERLGISEFLNRKLETLSKGNQQKVQLAETLICNPDIIILDEPFSGLDPVNSQILKDIVNDLIAQEKIVIFSSHQMSYVEEFCDDIVIIDKGEAVLSGSLKDIKKDFGDKRIILSANNYSLEEIKGICEDKYSKLVTVHGLKKEFVILELNEDVTKNMLLSEILKTDIDIETFGIYEPSLTDIFVKKVGEK